MPLPPGARVMMAGRYRVLPPPDYTTAYNAVIAQNPFGWWRASEISGLTVTGLIAGGGNMTLNESATITTDPTNWGSVPVMTVATSSLTMVTTLATSSWDFMSNGTGATLICPVVTTSWSIGSARIMFCSTAGGSSPNVRGAMYAYYKGQADGRFSYAYMRGGDAAGAEKQYSATNNYTMPTRMGLYMQYIGTTLKHNNAPAGATVGIAQPAATTANCQPRLLNGPPAMGLQAGCQTFPWGETIIFKNTTAIATLLSVYNDYLWARTGINWGISAI